MAVPADSAKSLAEPVNDMVSLRSPRLTTTTQSTAMAPLVLKGISGGRHRLVLADAESPRSFAVPVGVQLDGTHEGSVFGRDPFLVEPSAITIPPCLPDTHAEERFSRLVGSCSRPWNRSARGFLQHPLGLGVSSPSARLMTRSVGTGLAPMSRVRSGGTGVDGGRHQPADLP